MDKLPAELFAPIVRTMPYAQRQTCRLVSRGWCNTVDAAFPQARDVLTYSMCAGPAPEVVRLGHDLESTPRLVRATGAPESSVLLPSYAEVVLDPYQAFAQQRRIVPFYSAVFELQQWASLAAAEPQLDLSCELQPDTPTFGAAAAAYVRGWQEVGHEPVGPFDLVDHWCRYATAGGPMACDEAGALILPPIATTMPSLAISPRICADAKSSGRAQDRMINTIVPALLQDHVRRAKKVSLDQGAAWLPEVVAAVALPVRALCDSLRASGWTKDVVETFAQKLRERIFVQLDWDHIDPNTNSNHVCWQLRAVFQEEQARKLQRFFTLFDAILTRP